MSLVKSVGGFLNDWAENASETPDDLRRLADRETEKLSGAARDLQESSEETGRRIESNLRGSYGASYGGAAGRWLSNPVNLIGSIILVIGVIWAVQKGKL